MSEKLMRMSLIGNIVTIDHRYDERELNKEILDHIPPISIATTNMGGFRTTWFDIRGPDDAAIIARRFCDIKGIMRPAPKRPSTVPPPMRIKKEDEAPKRKTQTQRVEQRHTPPKQLRLSAAEEEYDDDDDDDTPVVIEETREEIEISDEEDKTSSKGSELTHGSYGSASDSSRTTSASDSGSSDDDNSSVDTDLPQRLSDISEEEDETPSANNESADEPGESASKGRQRNSVSNTASGKDNNASPPKGVTTAAGEGSDPSEDNDIQSTSSITSIIRKKQRENNLKTTLEANTTSRKPYPYGYGAMGESNRNKTTHHDTERVNPPENNLREEPRMINAINASIREMSSRLNNNTNEQRGMMLAKYNKYSGAIEIDDMRSESIGGNQRRENVPSTSRGTITSLGNKGINNHSTQKEATVKDANGRDDNRCEHQVRSNIPARRQLLFKQLVDSAVKARQASMTKDDRVRLPEEKLRFLIFIPRYRQERQVLADFRKFGTVINLTIMPDRGQLSKVGFILFENTGVARIALDANSDVYNFKKIRGRIIDKQWKHDPYTIHPICRKRMYRGDIRGHARICDSGRLQQTSHTLCEDPLCYNYH
ncbi:hypothetical protein TKK_0016135 [Trichogramma kaykai]|uniref:RRM domain-containing protein n=1 Tax=Trichogramma kaykai TaxID=54128 RepID=A0ABD2W9U5_9HYME